MRVDIIGAGPAGALTARLAALRHPDWAVHLHERLRPDDTFGFGVGLTRALLGAVQVADADMFDRLMAATFRFSSARFSLPQGTIVFGRSHSGAIRRSELLRILLDGAAEVGAHVHIGTSVHVDQLRSGADIVVGADGLSSSTRERFARHLGVRITQGRGAFIWCAAEIELDGAVFHPVRTSDGVFVAHCYPYAAGLSTFVIEASDKTVERAGFSDRTWESDSASDDEALDYLSDAFVKLLDGARFFGNRSRWTHFTTLDCLRWSHDNVVLIGDAVATVHPSLESGTKVALESAIALVNHLDKLEDQPILQTLGEFTRNRRPSVARLQEPATRSQLWWESFPARMDLSPARIAVAYLSRTGVVSLDSLAKSQPNLVTEAIADFCGLTPRLTPPRNLTEWILDQPFHSKTVSLAERRIDALQMRAHRAGALLFIASGDAWGPEGDAYLQRARDRVNAGAELITLAGLNRRSDVMDRLAVAERIRTETGVAVAIQVDSDHVDIVADGILAGRADLVRL